MFSEEIALSIRGVSKRYEMYDKPYKRLLQMLCAGRKDFFREFWALRDVSFDLHKGESIGVIGRNGAGKSTLLKIITGTLNATRGVVVKNGKVAALLELGTGFNPEFTGRENVYLNASLLGLTKTETRKRYQEIVDFADIGPFIDQPVKKYSSGMKVRLAFAVQSLLHPDILIVDEALAVGDMFFQQKCLGVMRRLIAEGTSVLFVSHSLAMVRQFCQRCVYLKNGKMVSIGTSRDVCDQYMNDTTALGKCAPAKESKGRTTVVSDNSGVHRFRQDKGFLGRCAQVSGNCAACYTALDFYDEAGRRISTCVPGARISAVASLVANEEVPAGAVAGLLCRDKKGLDLFALNTECYGYALGDLKKGGHYTLTWNFQMPLLKGVYNFSIGLKPNEFTSVFYHRLFSCSIMEVVYDPEQIVNKGTVLVSHCRITGDAL